MTLDEHKFEFSRKFAGFGTFGANNETNADRPMLSATECTLQRCIDYVDPRTFLRQGVSNKGWVEKTSYFRAKCVNISKTVGDGLRPKLLLISSRSCTCAFNRTKIDDL